MNPVLTEIVKNKSSLEKMVQAKCAKKDTTLSQIANYYTITALEFYIKHHDSRHPPIDNDEKCCFCMFEFFDDINKMSYEQLVEDLKNEGDEDIIELEHCGGHFFHIGCLKNYISTQTSTYIKCPICCHIYGVMIGEYPTKKYLMLGDQPKGTMKSYVDKRMHCAGYEKHGTIVIEYNFPSGTLPDGRRYYGTSRVAYLPDNEDGRECLRLLKISFDRRLTFTIGTSVTTGRSDSVIWNGIHHKTNLSGGIYIKISLNSRSNILWISRSNIL